MKYLHQMGDNECKWPVGRDKGGATFCCAPRSDHRYCAEHVERSRGDRRTVEQRKIMAEAARR